MKTFITVTGMRDWSNKQQVREALDWEFNEHLSNYGAAPPSDGSTLEQDFVLRHGCSGNVDTAANEWAREKGVTVERFRADWQMIGGGIDYSAGPRRNKKMAQALPLSHKCLAFWDGTFKRRGNRESSGTFNMITEALAAGILTIITPPRTP